jgi:hypothetical protein
VIVGEVIVGEAIAGGALVAEEIAAPSLADRAGNRGSVDAPPDPRSTAFPPGATVARI